MSLACKFILLVSVLFCFFFFQFLQPLLIYLVTKVWLRLIMWLWTVKQQSGIQSHASHGLKFLTIVLSPSLLSSVDGIRDILGALRIMVLEILPLKMSLLLYIVSVVEYYSCGITAPLTGDPTYYINLFFWTKMMNWDFATIQNTLSRTLSICIFWLCKWIKWPADSYTHLM